MTLHPCFQPASLNSPPHSPTKAGATIRIGSRRVTNQETVWRSSLEAPADSGEELSGGTGDSVAELSGGTGRQWWGAVRRHWGQCGGAVRHWGSSRGPDHRASPTLMADLQQLQQQDPVLRPVLAASTAKPSNMKERSTRALVQQYPRRFLKNGTSVVGRLTNVVVPVSSWFCPSHFGLMSQERSGTTSVSARDALWCHALGKRKGIWWLVWSFGNALCLYVNGLP